MKVITPLGPGIVWGIEPGKVIVEMDFSHLVSFDPDEVTGDDYEDYAGICTVCFEPVREKDACRFRPQGRPFHHRCVEEWPDNHFVVKEKYLAGLQ